MAIGKLSLQHAVDLFGLLQAEVFLLPYWRQKASKLANPRWSQSVFSCRQNRLECQSSHWRRVVTCLSECAQLAARRGCVREQPFFFSRRRINAKSRIKLAASAALKIGSSRRKAACVCLRQAQQGLVPTLMAARFSAHEGSVGHGAAQA
jgi:hypothetical protein